MRQILKEHLFPVLMLIIGAACAAFSIECFLIPNTILDGGVTGISMMINYTSGIALSILIVVINIPFFIIGFKALGKRFLFRGVFSTVAFALFLEVFKGVDTVTNSELLAVVFGGVLLGVGVGLVLRYGGCLDGTEIAAMLLSRKVGVSTGGIIFMINIFIYLTAGLLFGWDRALLSLLTYFITFKIIDLVEEGMNQARAAMIITEHAEKLADAIYAKLGRTCTFINAEGLVSGRGKTVLYCVITRVEVNELKRIIKDSDVSAFVTISEVSEILGNHIKRNHIETKPIDETAKSE